MARRKIYIPITRSGSSILASVLTQMSRNARSSLTREDKMMFFKIWFWSSVVVCLLVWMFS